jgi:restriction system protein
MEPTFVRDVLWQAFKQSWWMWLIVFVIYVLFEIFKAKKSSNKFSKINKAHSGRELLGRLRDLSYQEFEEYIVFLFNKLGYKSEAVGKSHDGGVDVIVEKDGVKQYIQCKKYNSRNKVNLHDVRDFYGSLIDFLANSKGYFITTSSFTLEAEKFAEDKPIELIDGYKLLDYIKMSGIDNKEYFNNTKEEKCPECGGTLVEKSGKYGRFFGCSNYPKCKYTKNIGFQK